MNIPIVLEDTIRLSWRGFAELFGGFRAIFDVAKLGPQDADAAALTLHGNWQLCYDIPEFQREMHRAFQMHFLYGDWVCTSFWDASTRKNSHEVLGPDDYVVPWVRVSVKPDYSDVPFFCTILQLYPHQIEEHENDWYSIETCKKGKPSWNDDPQQDFERSVQINQGILVDADMSGAPRKILNYEGWLSIPYQKNHQRYCRALVDYATGEVFHLSFLDEEDWRDRPRYESQLQQATEYRAAAFAFASGSLPEPPVRPDWMPADGEVMDVEPEPVRRVPLHMRAHGVCVEPTKGPLGIGFGLIGMMYNEAANLALDAFIDHTVGNNVPGYLTDNKALADKELIFEPGKISYVPRGMAPLKESLMKVDLGPADPHLVDIIKMMRDFSQSASHASDVMSGKPGKSGEPFRSQNERLEQALSLLGVATGKFVPAFEQILRNNAKLNSIHLSEEEFYSVTASIPMPDGSGNVGQHSIARRAYERNYTVTLRADLRFTSRQERVAEADQAVAMVMGHPGTAGNAALVEYCVLKAFEARGRWDIVQMAQSGWQQSMQQSAQQAQAQQQNAAQQGPPRQGPPRQGPSGQPPQ